MNKNGIYFMGMGISGGEDGARHGSSMILGRPKEPYQRVKPIFEVLALEKER